jgi:hypothetical protein
VQLNGIDAIQQILPEFTFFDHVIDRHIGSTDKSDIYVNFFIASYPCHFTILQYGQ